MKLLNKYPLRKKWWAPAVIDEKTGLKLLFFNGEVRAVEVSLPRFSNRSASNLGLFIEQAVVDTAVANILAAVDQWTAPGWNREWHFSRVDLVWNFPGHNLTRFVLAHEFATHPKAQAYVSLYRQKRLVTGITFQGSDFAIKIYDPVAKRLHRKKRPAHGKLLVTFPRVEIEIRKNRLKNLLGKGQLLQKLELQECYSVYRDLLLEFATQTEPVPKISGKDDAIYLAESKGLKVFPQLLPKLSGATRTKFLAGYEAWKRTNAVAFVDWNRLLPPTFGQLIASPTAKRFPT